MTDQGNHDISPELLQRYPLFMPPDDLAEKGLLNWNKKELKRYFDWYLSVFEGRVNFFLEFFNLKYSKDPDAIFSNGYSEMIFNLFDSDPLLTRTQKQHARADENPAIRHMIESETERKVFTTLGYAIATDSGLLYAKVVLDNRPDVTWAVPVKGGKSYIHYNKVVLKEREDAFGSSEWDPIGLGIVNIGYAINVSRKPCDYAKAAKETIQREI